MKFKDIRTIESILTEYGMKPGTSTPTNQQQSGATAKANAVSSPTIQKNTPKTQSKGSPTITPGLNVKEPEQEPEAPQLKKAKAKDMDVDAEYHNEKGEVAGKVVSKVGDSPNPDKVVVQDPKGEYQLVDPDEEVQILNASKLSKLSKSTTSSFSLNKQVQHKKNKAKKIRKKLGKLVRKIKLREQGEPIFEINFNSKSLAKSALNAPIKCGFEAETTWPDVMGGMDDDGDWLEGKTWGEVSDYIYDQEGSRSVDMIEQNYREWLMETDYFYDAESDVIRELVVDRKEDEYYLDDYVSSRVSESDVEAYREDMLANLEADKDDGNEDAAAELEEREDWDIDAWGREYVEENEQDGFEEWLADEIRDNGEHWDDAWERAMEACDIDRYMEEEHGSWYDLLRSEDIYLYNEDAGGGRDEVASRLEDWASNNSMSNDVRAGDYHSGSGVDNTYWRVEDDSSIEGEGTGAEIISPVYNSPAEMLKEMKNLFEFLQSEGVETNSSTGLHITMSWTQLDDVEANKLKMALLLGDKYVAKQFDRESNGYSKSQMQNIQSYINDVKQDINNEKSLGALEQIISKGISPGKFSSINFKDAENEYGNNLIEFRVAGGNDYHTMMDVVMKTVIRYSAVMQAGHDREAFKQDYVKALFRLIKGQDDITTDVQRKAQQVVDPETIDDKVLGAFQAIASKKHYTDSIEALSNAYMQLADVKKMRDADPQGELDLGEDEEAESQDWRRQMKVAQKYFVRAFAMLASDVASGANRASAKVAQVSALRGAMKDFGLTTDILWRELQQSEFVKNFPGEHHIKLEKMAAAMNSLLKKQDAKAPEAAYTITVPRGHVLLMPEPKFITLFRDIFGNNEPDANATVNKDDFKVINDAEIDKVKRARYEMEYNERYIENEQDMIKGLEDQLKTADPENAKDLKDAIRKRQERVAEWQAENSEYRIDVEAFVKKHGFAPASVRSTSEPIGTPYRHVHDDHRNELSQRFNIRFDVKESKMTAFDKFDKLSLAEQLIILAKVDKKKIDEAWSKKYKDSINCSNPKGFSQKAHCAGKKKNEGWGDSEKRQFKRDELQHELGHEKNNYAVMINGKPWKVVADKSRAQKMVQTLIRKGKDAKYAETGMPVSETIEAEQDMAALLTAYGTPKKKKKSAKVKESAVNNFDRSKILNNLMSDHFPVGDLKKQMLAYQAIPVPAMLDEFRRLRAEAGDDACARNIVKHFVNALPKELQQAKLKESKIFESSNKEDAKELVQLSSTPSVLATVVKYLRSLVSKQAPQQDVPHDSANATTPTDRMSSDQEQQVEKESIIKEDLNTLKQEAFALIDEVKDEVELNQLVAFLRKNEIFELAHSAIEANITQGVKGGLDKKLGQMVLDTPGTFEDKEQFLQQLSTGNGFWDGQDLITNPTGNIYDKLSSNAVAKELAKPLALELRGRMGYGPDQGPGEFLLAFTGKGVDLAEKSDLVLISGKGVEVKAEGWSKDAKGNTKKSGGRLYSTSGYNGGSGAGKVLYNALLQIGVPKDILATQYGWGVKRDKSVKYPPLNFNSVGVKNINELLQQYGKSGDAEKILDSIAEGFFLSLPSGMKDIFVKKSSKNNQIDFTEAMHNFVALGHAYYKHQEGHDYIMIFNTATGDYVMVNTAEDMKNLLDAGVLKASGGMDFFDDRSKGTPQILIGKI